MTEYSAGYKISTVSLDNNHHSDSSKITTLTYDSDDVETDIDTLPVVSQPNMNIPSQDDIDIIETLAVASEANTNIATQDDIVITGSHSNDIETDKSFTTSNSKDFETTDKSSTSLFHQNKKSSSLHFSDNWLASYGSTLTSQPFTSSSPPLGLDNSVSSDMNRNILASGNQIKCKYFSNIQFYNCIAITL